MPRAGDVATPAGLGDCSVTCKVPDSEARARFDATSGEVDYARYCPSFCRTFGVGQEAASDDALLCAAETSVTQGSASGQAQQPSAWQLELLSHGAGTAAGPAPAPAQADVSEEVTDAILDLAKTQMEEARRHAEAAGAGAKTAREAYEATLATSSTMGTAAGKAMFEQIRRAAGEQASAVLRERRRYEDAARVKAMKASQEAAMVYRKAKIRDLALADTWVERADQFKQASESRERLAEDDAMQAEQYLDDHDDEAANDYKAKAREEMVQSDTFSEEADAAKKQAEAIVAGAAWYDEAMQAAAASAMAAALPPDVAPVPLPALR